MFNSDTSPPGRPGIPRHRIIIALVILLALLVLAIGYQRRQSRRQSREDGNPGRPVPRVEASPVAGSLQPDRAGDRAKDLVVSPEVIARTGLKTTRVETRTGAATLRTTAIVQPNSYRETPIMPLVEGRVTKVNVQLGDRVRVGQTLATIFSADLAEAQMKYLTVDANLQFHVAQAARFEKLATIGAVSRQELEEVLSRLREHHAEHASLRERMLLYGLTDEEISSLRGSGQLRSDVPVHAPAGGVITTRDINVGQNLSMRDRLFTITDLSTVWVVANIYEKDFSLAATGRGVTITTSSWPGRSWTGRISYVDPRIDEETRTARARIEIPNQDQRLRLGMFVDVAITATGTESFPAVPKSAIQTIGDQKIVFVPAGPGRFQVRRLLTGAEDGEYVRVVSGLAVGEEVVTDGSFFLMAELGRKGD